MKDGPKPDSERGCTDIICCIVFIAFTIGSFVIASFAFSNGQPKLVSVPYDMQHRACGIDEGVKNFPMIYFLNPTSPTYLWRTACVSSCPTEGESAIKCAVEPSEGLSSCNANENFLEPENMVLIYDSEPLLGKVCMPTVAKYFK